MLVDGVTKLDKVKYGDSAQAETVRKMIVAMSKDIRVLLIKLADRLHNARTWGFVPAGVGAGEGARRPSRSTRRSRTGSASRPSSRSSRTSRSPCCIPKLYAEIESLVKQRTPQREEFVQNVIDARRRRPARAAQDPGPGHGPPEAVYSIYQKMVVRGREFDEIYDLVGIRVLVNSVRDCYAVLGAIHARWTPLPGRFKDYIATPKFNLYQSLHTTVIGPSGRAVEIQIRTHEMHQRAEFGVAAHWKYKERVNGGKAGRASRVDTDMAWLAHISDWQAETADPGRVPRLAALRDRRQGGLRLHAEGPGDRASGRRDARSTSPTRCTPRSATARWARRSTAGSCRSRASSPAATSSRCSRRRTRMPGRARTG